MEKFITVITTLIILAIVCLIVRKVMKDRAAKEALEVKEVMAEHNEVAKNQAFRVSDRLSGQVTMHKIHWLTMSDHGSVRTYLRYEDLKAAEELTLQEKAEMDSIVAHLARVREFRDEYVLKPLGYIEHKHPRFGQLVEYTPGIKILGGRNKMAIVVEKTAEGEVFVREIHISLNLGNEIADVYEIADADGKTRDDEWMRYQEDYKNNEQYSAAFAVELNSYQVVTTQLTRFNQHRKFVKFNDKAVAIEYRGERVSPRAGRKAYQDAVQIEFQFAEEQ